MLLLDDRTAEGSHDLQLQSIAHGVVMLQSLERDFGIKRRRVEVRKLRGSRLSARAFTITPLRRAGLPSIPG